MSVSLNTTHYRTAKAAKKHVLRQYSDARCSWNHDGNCFIVFAESYSGMGRWGYGELGMGRTEGAAWKDAAKLL